MSKICTLLFVLLLLCMHVSDSRIVDFYEAVRIVVVSVHTVKAYWRIGCIAPLFLYFGTRWIEWSLLLHGRFTRRVKTSGYPLNKQ